ncbi:MAG: NAD(P)H-dependent glycerol-3-phosphate dehydrogenase [Pseudomonadota bacterium]
MQIGVIGGGNFGTAVANIIGRNGHQTWLWMRDGAQVADTREHRENRRYLPGHTLPPAVEPTASLEQAVQGSDLLFVSVPSTAFRTVARQMAPLVRADTGLISLTKGIEREGFKLMSEILAEEMPNCPVGALSGPNLAEEIAQGQFSGTVVASPNAALRATALEVLKNSTFRVYPNPDLYGVELGGALKNIYAIVCGMAAALKVGQNTVGMLITRSLAEMSRFAVRQGANPFTFLGLAGVGDLLVTCTSPLSRNYRLGELVGSGLSLNESAEQLGKLAEGVNTLAVVRARSQELGVYMPLVEGLHKILHEGQSIGVIVHELMTGADNVDVEFASPSEWETA